MVTRFVSPCPQTGQEQAQVQALKTPDILDFPYGQFLMLRPEYVAICQNEIEAKVLRIVESLIQATKTFKDWKQKAMAAIKQGLAVPPVPEIYVSISYPQFTAWMFGTVKSEKTLIPRIKSLLAKKFLIQRPDPANPHTSRQYTLNLSLIQEWLRTIPQSIGTFFRLITKGVPENDTPQCQELTPPVSEVDTTECQELPPSNIGIDTSSDREIDVCKDLDSVEGKDQTPSPDAHTHDTLSQLPIATDAIAPWLQEAPTLTFEEVRDEWIEAYEAYWEALLIHLQRPVIPSCYTEDEQSLDFSMDGKTEEMQEVAELNAFFADRGGSYETEHDEEEETPPAGAHPSILTGYGAMMLARLRLQKLDAEDEAEAAALEREVFEENVVDADPPVEQMSTDVDNQASTVDKDKPSNRDVAQETEGTHGHLSSQHHSGVVGPQHDLAHHPGDDTRSSAQAVSAAELIAAEARAVYPMPEMQKPAILGDRQRAACATNIPTNPTSDNETVKGNGNQKHIPVQSQKVGNRGKKAVIPEPTAEAKVVIERWQAVFWQLFKKRILVTPQIIEAAELLAPLDLSVDELIDLRAFCFRANPTWYKDKGLCLMDCYKNVEKWRSLQGDTGETRLSSFDDPNYRVEDEFYPDHHERSAHYAACS